MIFGIRAVIEAVEAGKEIDKILVKKDLQGDLAKYIFAVFIGPYMTVSAVWTIADIFNGLMALPNMIALFALSGVVAKETKKFFEKHNKNKYE